MRIFHHDHKSGYVRGDPDVLPCCVDISVSQQQEPGHSVNRRGNMRGYILHGASGFLEEIETRRESYSGIDHRGDRVG
jgi:hypothetical protein